MLYSLCDDKHVALTTLCVESSSLGPDDVFGRRCDCGYSIIIVNRSVSWSRYYRDHDMTQLSCDISRYDRIVQCRCGTTVSYRDKFAKVADKHNGFDCIVQCDPVMHDYNRAT